MKREELTPIDLEWNMGPDVNVVVRREPWKAYDIDEVNLLLDEKDAEIEDLLRQNREQCNEIAQLKEKLHDVDNQWNEQCKEIAQLKSENEQLKAKLESVQASAYAESVDAGMRERRLRRALYKACANWAYATENLAANFIDVEDAKKWAAVEAKCIKKAEEYK